MLSGYDVQRKIKQVKNLFYLRKRDIIFPTLFYQGLILSIDH